MMQVATITVDSQGRLTEDSTLTIDGVTTLIPAHSGGGWLAPRRIADALAARGYRPATDYYSDLDGPRDGVLTIVVCWAGLGWDGQGRAWQGRAWRN